MLAPLFVSRLNVSWVGGEGSHLPGTLRRRDAADGRRRDYFSSTKRVELGPDPEMKSVAGFSSVNAKCGASAGSV